MASDTENKSKPKATKKVVSKKKVSKKASVKKKVVKKTVKKAAVKKKVVKKLTKKVAKKISVKKTVKKKALQKKPITLKADSADLDSFATHAIETPASTETLQKIEASNNYVSNSFQPAATAAAEISPVEDNNSLIIKLVIVVFMSLAVVFYVRSLFVTNEANKISSENQSAEIVVDPVITNLKTSASDKTASNLVKESVKEEAPKVKTEAKPTKFPPPPTPGFLTAKQKPVALPDDQMQLIKETFAPEYFK